MNCGQSQDVRALYLLQKIRSIRLIRGALLFNEFQEG